MKPLLTTEVKQEIEEDPDLVKDLKEARINIKEIAATGLEAIAEAVHVAGMSQRADHYAALSSLMKSTLDANRDLIDLHKSKRELQNEMGDITNNLFVGSTAELQQLLIESQKKK